MNAEEMIFMYVLTYSNGEVKVRYHSQLENVDLENINSALLMYKCKEQQNFTLMTILSSNEDMLNFNYDVAISNQDYY